MEHAHRIQFVDSFVRRNHWRTMTYCLMTLALVICAGVYADIKAVKRPPVQIAMAIIFVGLIAGLHAWELWRRKTYGLYVVSDTLILSFAKRYRLDLQPNIHGKPLVILRKVGRRWEITSVSQRTAIYVPVAAIPTLPQILIHYDLDVKVVDHPR